MQGKVCPIVLHLADLLAPTERTGTNAECYRDYTNHLQIAL
jgi:hypothetical protein